MGRTMVYQKRGVEPAENYLRSYQLNNQTVECVVIQELVDIQRDARGEANLAGIHHGAKDGADEVVRSAKFGVELAALFIGLANYQTASCVRSNHCSQSVGVLAEARTIKEM